MAEQKMLTNKESIHILIIDDQPDNLRFLSNILTTEGYKVQRAISGEICFSPRLDFARCCHAQNERL
jgi:two-component system sensor histidine kinase/response regulator